MVLMQQSEENNPAISALEHAQRRELSAGLAAILTLGIFLTVTTIVEVLSHISEAERVGKMPIWGQALTGEVTSRVVILLLLFGLLILMIRTPLNLDNWRRRLPVYLLAMIAFSVLHVVLMVLLRKICWPVFIGAAYDFVPSGSSLLGEFVYEFRKDVVSFWTAFAVIGLFQHNATLQQELAGARQEARQFSRLTLKCGGRSIFLDAHQIEWAKAAGNYVELFSQGKTHLARMTLTALEDQLVAAGADTVRVHRSWLVNRKAIEQIRPAAAGDQQLLLTSEMQVPVSRRYRDRLSLD